ncbi:MAG: MBL fold metallo-hydrolase [Deltaproteobacteria bacterium]|nr:MBL fold metallo-hydrolase [Deltaproteobacteria bacterium]
MLSIRRLQLGPMANFVYLVAPAHTDRLAVVDPGWDAAAIEAAAEAIGRPVTDLILTHHHGDHRNAVEALLDRGAERVWVHRAERPWLQGLGWTDHCHWLDGGDRIELGPGAALTCIATPGHTPGSQCLLGDSERGPALLTGDTLFIDGCGRCDLPGGDPAAMYHTLYGILGNLDGQTRVLPGHDYAPAAEAALDDQRRTNPYLGFASVQAFVDYRMRPRR